ncbi:MAG: ComEA family DNA-binding protein [Actinomycetales bacterium]|nr:ComEA family DNA-binding protein [Actinomycetales bacterium]
MVHVAGQVREPGVVAVDAGARVQDAVRAAGGLTGEADTSRVNLARPVIDGERIWVPRPGEDVPEIIEGTSGSGAGGGEAPSGGGGASGGGRAGAIVQVNLNTADQAALEELPGVGPVTAAAILQWRADHGQFTSPDELLEVSGIGEATLEKLRPHVTL